MGLRKLGHFTEYSIFAIFLYFALGDDHRSAWNPRKALACILLGLQNFLVSISTGPREQVTALLDFCTEVVVAYGRAMQRTGVHGIQYGDASASLIGPEMYRQYVLPFQERTVAGLGGGAC